jgi:hypothetical protein
LAVSWALLAYWAWKKRINSAGAIVMAIGVLLLFSPVINPWYLLWLLPMATVVGQHRLWVSPWVASIALPWS